MAIVDNKLVICGIVTFSFLAACGDTSFSEKSNNNIPAEIDVALPKIEEVPKVLGDNTFETWSYPESVLVQDSVALSPNGENDADKVTLQNLIGITKVHHDISVKARDTAEAKIWLWGTEGDEVVLSIVRSCGASPAEFVSKKVTLTAEPVQYFVSKTFENDHTCILTQIQGVGDNQEIYAYAHTIQLNP